MEVNKDSYLKYLRMANRGNLGPVNRLGGLERRLVQELVGEGLISDSKERFLSSNEKNRCFITPKGGITLADWDRDIREGAWWFKALASLTRLLWVLIGVLATVVGKYLITRRLSDAGRASCVTTVWFAWFVRFHDLDQQ